MLSDAIKSAINAQINRELYSSYLYFAMECQAQAFGLPGIAHWFRLQCIEELGHVNGFVRYLNDQGARVLAEAIERPQVEFESALAMFEKTLSHEKDVTRYINDLATLAAKENDHATAAFLLWYVREQVEEESGVNTILDSLRVAGAQGPGLFMVDKELGSRTYTPPNIP